MSTSSTPVRVMLDNHIGQVVIIRQVGANSTYIFRRICRDNAEARRVVELLCSLATAATVFSHVARLGSQSIIYAIFLLSKHRQTLAAMPV